MRLHAAPAIPRAILRPPRIDLVRRKIPEALIPMLEGEVEEDLGKVFGEELPSGLVAATVPNFP